MVGPTGGLLYCGDWADSVLFWMPNTVSARASVQYTVFLLLYDVCGKLEFRTIGLRFSTCFVELIGF